MDNYNYEESPTYPKSIGLCLPRLLLERPALTSQNKPNSKPVDGKKRRYEIVDTLRNLADLAHSPAERNQFRDLANLCAFTANDNAWATPDGPLIGARNETIAKILAHDRGEMSPAVAGRHLNALYRAGWLERENLGANHRRYWKKDTHSGLDFGRGYRLRPVIRELEALQKELKARQEVRKNDENTLRNLYAKISQFIETTHDECCRAIARGLQRAASRVSPKSSRFGATVMELVQRFAAVCTKVDPSKLTHQTSEISRPIYEPDNSFRSSTANASSCANTRSTKLPKSWRKPSSEQYLGIDEARITHSEIQSLFPVLGATQDRYSGQMSIVDKAWQLAKSHRLDLDLITQTMRNHDQLAVALMVIVTVQNFADGKLWSSPASYFRGLVRKARLGSLNLCPTIFGKRRGV